MMKTLTPIRRSTGKVCEWVMLGSVIICGDLITQKIEHSKSKEEPPNQTEKGTLRNNSHKQPFEVDYRRLKGVAITGFAFLAPVALVWYPLLHRFMAVKFCHLAEGSARYVMTKVVLENILLPAPVCMGYFVIPALVEGGHQWETLPHRIRVDFLPTVTTDVALWCVLSPINFKYVPLKYQPLFSCVIDGVEAAGMSFLTHQDDFKWPSWSW